MSRVALEPFTVDKISYGPHPNKPGHIRARARYRREAGDTVLRDVYGTGTGKDEEKAKAAARRDLLANLKAKSEQHWGGSASITAQTTVGEVAKVWLREKEHQRPPLAPRTLEEYAKWVHAYITGTDFERLTIGAAANQARAEEYLRQVANGTHRPRPPKKANGHHRRKAQGGEGAMKAARKVLRGIFDTAHLHGAIPNAVALRQQGRTVEDDRRRVDTDRAFTREELRAVQEEADKSSADVGDLVAFLSAFGPRISEALAVMWTDVDIDNNRVRIPGTKSENADREADMPEWVVDRLKARAEKWGTKGAVFGVTRYAERRGQVRDTSNVINVLRGVLDRAGCEWAGTHTWRRTVATMLDAQGHGVGAIATLLGQDPVTTMGYIKTGKVGSAALTFDSPW